MSKSSYEEVKRHVESFGFKLLSKEYRTTTSLLEMQCPVGHVFSMSLLRFNRAKRRKCPECRPNNKPKWERVQQAFIVRGYTLLSNEDEYKNNETKLRFICNSGHENTITWGSLVAGCGCSLCKGHTKLDFQEVKKAFEDRGYVLHSKHIKRSKDIMRFTCPNGHRHHITWNKFQQGEDCGLCAKNKKKDFAEVEKAFQKEGYTILGPYKGMHSKVLVSCPRGHIYSVQPTSFMSGGKRCKSCFDSLNYSSAEKEILLFVRSLLRDAVILENTKSVIPPKELDIYIPSKNLAIEYCGLHWHSEGRGNKGRAYHYEKMIKCAESGIRLITIFEDEYLDKKEIVLSRISSSLGVYSDIIYARDTVFSLLSHKEAALFLNNNHLQGYGPSKYKCGLLYKGDLVLVATFGPASRAHAGGPDIIELKRLATKCGVCVVGGAGKVIKNAARIIQDDNSRVRYIKSYCDMRWSGFGGTVYDALGFNLVSFTKYTPHYIYGKCRYRNQTLRKNPAERLTGKTEYELRLEQGYDRIWDCGHRTYILDLQKVL